MRIVRFLIALIGLTTSVSFSQNVVIEGTIRVDRNWTEIGSSLVDGETGDDGVPSRVIFENTGLSVVTPNSNSSFYLIEVAKTAAAAPDYFVRLNADANAKERLILTDGVLDLNAHSMVIQNSGDDGITFQDGTGILAETHPSDVDILGGVPGPGYGYVKWEISNQENLYVVPFVTQDLEDVRLQYEITESGNNGGRVNFSTYGTPNNNQPWASGVTQFDAGGSDGSANVADRYYIVEQGSYTQLPKGWLTFKYLISELDAGLQEERLAAQRYNTIENSWGDWLYSPSANTGNKTVSVYLSNPLDYFDAWVLSDQDNPLPVELLDFSTKQSSSTVDIYWTTASEVNSDYFEIQRTSDGTKFETIGTTKAAGFSTSLINYLHNDAAPLSGVSYYRLKSVDLDGKFEYSALKAVYFNKLNSNSLTASIFPNPTSGNELSIEIGNELSGNVKLEINDAAGRVAYTKELTEKLTKLTNLSTFLNNGMYFVTLHSSYEKVSLKLIVD